MLARTSPFRFQIRMVVSLEAVMINFPRGEEGGGRQRSGEFLGLKPPHSPTAVAVSEQRNLSLHQSCQENQKQHQYISTYLLAQSEKPCQQAHLLGMRYCSVRTQQLTAANPETPCASHPASFRSYLQSSVLSSGNIADLIKLCFNQKTYL